MKIVYIASAQSYYHTKWYEYFISKGYKVQLISPEKARAEIPGVTIHCFPQFKFRMLRLVFTVLLGGTFVRRIIRRENPDILHAIELDEGFAAATSGFHPFVMTPNGSDLLVWAKKHFLIRLIARYIFSKADAVTSDSELLKQASIELGASTNRNHIIQWGVDLTQFHSRLARAKIRKKYGIGDSPLILSARPLMPIYNIDTIIRCLPEVLKELPSAKIMFVYGFADKEAEMKRLTAKLGVANSIIFVGPVNHADMPYYVAAADVCISVPSSDSSPRIVYEAMACGVPPILSDIPWTQDFITLEQNALLVPVRDHQALAAAIMRLLTNNALRQRIIETNMRLVDERLNYHKHMAKMEEIYQSLCKVK